MGIAEDYIDAVLAREGGYVDIPADRGGPTAYGISEAVARAYGWDGPMAALPLSIAADIYERRFWYIPRLDTVEPIDPALAAKLLDVGVNMGTGIAGKFLQRALNVLNQRGTLWPDLTMDGLIGPMTLHALRAFGRLRGKPGQAVLHEMIRALQVARYVEIAEMDPTQEQFAFGWATRAAA